MNANASNYDPVDGGAGGTLYCDEHRSAYYQQGGGDDYYDPDAGFQDCSERHYFDQQQHHDAAGEFQGQWNVPGKPVGVDTAEPGFYFPLPHMSPQLYSAPVSAIAYDSGHAAIYVASHTQPFGERPRRASVLVTHSTLDGRLHSSCGGHPEADMRVMQSIYKTCYTSSAGQASINQRHSHIPPHAFQPPYGATLQQPHAAHMGITTLLPTSLGYVTSVSPAGVRVHTVGGLCVSDNDTSGMISGTPHPASESTHVSVGGCNSQIHCMDIYQDLRIVSSHYLGSDLAVIAMAKNENKQALVAGCSDGTLRLVDGRMRGAEVAKIKSHVGGITAVASSGDGNLVATTGFAAKSGSSVSGPYAYPDPNVLIYDVRFLGRGGIVHTFSGVKGAPRFVSFMPEMENQPSNRFLVASGQPGGGMQIIAPFEEPDQNPASFLFPQLDQGESISCMTVSGQHVAVGTSKGNLLQFELAGYKEQRMKVALDPRAAAFSRSGSSSVRTSTAGSGESGEKMPLEMPAFYPEPPPMSIDPSVLFSSKQTGMMNSMFSTYIMCGNPQVTPLGSQDGDSPFGQIARKPMIPSSKRTVSDSFLGVGSRSEGDSGIIVPTAAFGVSLIPRGLSKPTTPARKDRKGKPMLANPNKMVFSDKMSSICYLQDSRKKGKNSRWKEGARGSAAEVLEDENGQPNIPDRYRLTLRPQNVATNHFTHSKRNGSGIWPGWDYPPSMPSSHAPSVLALLYFVPEIRCAMLERQFAKQLYASKTVDQVPTLCTALGFLFHNMESISHNAMVYPGDGVTPQVGVFIPTNFLTAFSAMPEAVNLALLDDNPAVAIKARRPEAFYRFLLHHLDKEAGLKKNSKKLLLDSLHGINFVSSNEVVAGKGKPTISTTRSLTLDLSYEPFINAKDQTKWRFGDVLCHSLCRETKYRSWNNGSHSYETVVQRKIATSLPDILSLSCACAGRKPEEGLSIWRTSCDDFGLWLPELIEVELEEDGTITVREQVDSGDNQKKWIKVEGKTRMPASTLDLLTKERGSMKSKVRYRLESVISSVRDDSSSVSALRNSGDKADGHHVLHVRVPPDYRKRALTKQREHADQLSKLMIKSGRKDSYKRTLTSSTPQSVLKSRIERVKESLKAKNPNDWVLFNGYVVTPTTVEDARAFHINFKEPCIVMYRAVGENSKAGSKNIDHQPKDTTNVMQSRSISTGKPSQYAIKNISDLPDSGDIIALDAEFVSVQEEETMLGDSGKKIVLRETRHALGRVSVIDCRTGKIIIDDHVLPKEPVYDYLTRFSGIVAGDLDPKTSPHHLVTARTAYLKLRLLMERGCIFLGHGLSSDFLTVNLFVSPCQIIDTVEIYHKERTRFISLRFLANYVLKRDMQQEVHCSVEDAMAAYELYQRADNMITEGIFDKFLNELYAYGQKTDWRIGVLD